MYNAMYRTKCSPSDGCSPPAPTVMVTSNHWPRFTESGATIFGVCFGSTALRSSLYSGVNCSSWPAQAQGAGATMAAMAAPAMIQRLAPIMALVSSGSGVARHPANGVEKLPRTVGLGEIGGGARGHGLLVVPREGEGGDDDDGDLGGLRLRPDGPRGIETGELGELHVHDDHVRLVASSRHHPRLPVVGLEQVIGLAGEEIAHDLPIEFVVLHEEDLLLPHAASLASATRRGTAKEKVEPRPGSLSTQMRPPWSSTKVLVMLSPRPVPPNSRLMLASTWRNSAKMWSSWSAGMPMPVSDTLYTTSFPSRRAVMVTCPCLVNLSALPTRLVRHWVMRLPSPWATGKSGATSAVKSRPFSSARERREVRAVSTTSGTE